jgi:DNA (cytosine-5)-methyltransferase 1
MNILDLFSGIGGFSLGLESVGMHTVAFCEQDGYARQVLRKHWPDVWLYDDVKTLTAKRLKADGIGPIDLICGGFPCQDISCAGKGAGIEGSRSGLWSEYARIIREVRPRWVIAENVPALRGRGADRVLDDLGRAGYTAWPLVVGALHAGAPHQRQRVWIVAHASGNGRVIQGSSVKGRIGPQHEGRRVPQSARRDRISGTVSYSASPGFQARRSDRMGKGGKSASGPAPYHGGWRIEPDVGRVAHGVPSRVDRLRCLGNAVVPQVVAMIGRAILDYEQVVSV